MGNDRIIAETLARGESVYLADDFYDMAVRIAPGADGGAVYYRKFRKGHLVHEEAPIDPARSDTAFEVILGGDIITSAEYDAWDT